MTFKQIRLSGWRQYDNIDISFHRQLTIITGANGAGKTTILNLLGRHFGWQGALVSTPRKRRVDTASSTYSTDHWPPGLRETLQKLLEDEELEIVEIQPETIPGPESDIGTIIYDNDTVAQLRVPKIVGNTYQVSMHNVQQVKGLHIPSHRPIYGYQPVQSIPTTVRKREDVFNTYINIAMQRYHGQHHQWTPNYYIKETLISLSMFGYGNPVVESNKDSLELFQKFEQVLSYVLPQKLGFKRIAIRIPEVVMITKSGEFSLDAASGGIASIIDIAWQIFMCSPESQPFVATIDEPENHLHPELQRTFLSSLITAFPLVQFVVASHNPFIVSSVPDSNVYVLNYDRSHRVHSEYLDTVNRAGTSNEILRDVLGLEFTMPLWVESRLDALIERFEGRDVSTESLNELRDEMGGLGLERYIPDTIAQIVKRKIT
jgi:predicted ATPase